MKNVHARWLFGSAAAFNFAVAGGLLFLRSSLASLLGLDPVTGTNIAIANITGAMVALFGYAYGCLASNPIQYRAYIRLGIIGKLAVVAAVMAPWLGGAIDWRLPAMTIPDAVYAALFANYLRRASAP